MDRRNFLLWGSPVTGGLAIAPERALSGGCCTDTAISSRDSHVSMYYDQQWYFRELIGFLKQRA